MSEKKKVMVIDGVEWIKKDSVKQPEPSQINEKEYAIIDPANVIALGKVQNLEDKEKPLHLIFDFPHKEDLRVITDLLQNEAFEIQKDGEKWGRYSLQYLELAKKVLKAWTTGTTIFFAVQAEKNQPCLMYCDYMGFVLAPRVESEE